MEVHACLPSDVSAFNFEAQDFEPLRHALPNTSIEFHRDYDSLRLRAATVTHLLSWDFESAWYPEFPVLEAIYTPAAGNDWVAEDPAGRVVIRHGTFHGPILAESLLSAVLYMNHRMPAMVRNFQARGWDRNLQQESTLVANQTILIIGQGNIGSRCAELLRPLCARVIGVRRQAPEPSPGNRDIFGVSDLESLLPLADHVVLLLPGAQETDAFMSEDRLRQCKPGAYLYNFGRGNAIRTDDLLKGIDHLGGAFLDVVDEEPLSPNSPLWSHPNVMITPHSSCVYRDYKFLFVAEVIANLT